MGRSEEVARNDGEIAREQFPSPPADEKRDSDEAQDATNTGGLAGVEKMQATVQTWTKPWLIAAYAWYVKSRRNNASDW